MENPFDIIKWARALASANPENEISEATKKDYAAKIKRLRARLDGDHGSDAIVQEALKTTKKATWQATRAAMIYTLMRNLRQGLVDQDKVQRGLKALAETGSAPDQGEWLKLVARVQSVSNAVQAVLDAKLPIEGREDRHSKRQDMRGLPEEWRERIIARMPKYHDQALVAAVTGCRPAELVSGVEMSIDQNTGELVAVIKGAKSTEKTGQEWRRLSWPANSDSPLVRRLADLVNKHPAGSTVRIVTKSAKAFSGAMSRAGEREWPKRKSAVTPYCMRHQVAADMKASGSMSSGDISAALGHVSDVTKSTYGHANMGRKSGGVAPKKVEAARPVQTKTPSPAARKATRQLNGEKKAVLQSNPGPRMSP